MVEGTWSTKRALLDHRGHPEACRVRRLCFVINCVLAAWPRHKLQERTSNPESLMQGCTRLCSEGGCVPSAAAMGAAAAAQLSVLPSSLGWRWGLPSQQNGEFLWVVKGPQGLLGGSEKLLGGSIPWQDPLKAKGRGNMSVEA